METDILIICDKVLNRLKNLGCENKSPIGHEALIFPVKDLNGVKNKRISEQELRLIFIEEFKNQCSSLRYSIETPTRYRYKFGSNISALECSIKDKSHQSASVDMTIFEGVSTGNTRLVNVEFKYDADQKSVAKDILKLVHEEECGVFIQLINNRNSGTIENRLNKLRNSFNAFGRKWHGKSKYVFVVLMVLDKPELIVRKILNSDLGHIDKILVY